METAQIMVDEAEVIPLSQRFDSNKRDIRRSGKVGVDIYTEEQYNRYGWAREADALTTNEIDDVYSKVMEKGSLKRFPQSIDGEAIIVVNDKAKTTLEAEDVFVFATGRRDAFTITKVLKPFYYTDDVRTNARKAIYDKFKHMSDTRALAIISYMFDRDGFFDYFSRKNSKTYQEYLARRKGEGEIYGEGGSGSEENPSDAGSGKDGSGDTFGAGNKIKRSSKTSSDGDQLEPSVNLPLLNRSKFKIYTKENAETIIGSIAHNSLNFNDGTQGIIKDKGELIHRFGKNQARGIMLAWGAKKALFFIIYLNFLISYGIIGLSEVIALKITKENDNIYRITTPYKDIFTTIYLIKTRNGALLFDCGSYPSDVNEYVIPFLNECGVDELSIKYLFISHDHADHSGGLSVFYEKFPSTTVVSGKKALTDKYQNSILPSDGDVLLDVLKVVTIPGHTSDAMGIIDLRTNTLISGDCLQIYGLYGSGEWGSNITLIKQHFDALDKLEKMSIENILTAHDYHPNGYKYIGKDETYRAIKDCREALLGIASIIKSEPKISNAEITAKCNDRGLPRISERVVAALRSYLEENQ